MVVSARVLCGSSGARAEGSMERVEEVAAARRQPPLALLGRGVVPNRTAHARCPLDRLRFPASTPISLLIRDHLVIISLYASIFI